MKRTLIWIAVVLALLLFCLWLSLVWKTASGYTYYESEIDPAEILKWKGVRDKELPLLKNQRAGHRRVNHRRQGLYQ